MATENKITSDFGSELHLTSGEWIEVDVINSDVNPAQLELEDEGYVGGHRRRRGDGLIRGVRIA
jgi:hypothetical protein